MNDRYLFRGKRKLNGKWVEGSLIYGENDWAFIVPIGTEIEDYKHVRIRIITDSIGQFTGLTDKNGVKIFEEDIIKFQKFANWNEETLTRNTAKVIFKEGCFMWDIIKEGHNTGYYTSYQNEPLKNTNSVFGLEVIGNIHDK